MERLKGKTILIGKEPGQSRLLVSVVVNGQHKTVAIGQLGSVPNTVSRCKPTEETAHCKIEVDDAGNMTLTNLKPANVTYVNGQEIISKHVTSSCAVALGCNRFAIDLGKVLDAAKELIGVVYSIKHLEQIWNEHNEGRKKIRIRQKNINLLTGIPIFFTMLGSILIGIAPAIQRFAIIFTIIAAVIMLIGFFLRFTDKSIKEEDELNNKFQDNYICPNPKCRHFMGNQPYKILRQNKKCPYCGFRLTDK